MIMTDITFNNWQTAHTVPNEVAEYIAMQERCITALHGAIHDLQDKKRIAAAHPTKENRIEVWRSELELFKMLPDKQVVLF